jgi:hypothetical protein
VHGDTAGVTLLALDATLTLWTGRTSRTGRPFRADALDHSGADMYRITRPQPDSATRHFE